jgi:hypothetical protein
MILGVSYDDALNFFPHHPDNTKGFLSLTLDAILADRGYALQRKTKHLTGFNTDRDPWPCAPFAPMHWCQVKSMVGGLHAIIMLDTGRVLDPAHDNRVSIYDPDYASVEFMTGVYKVK